MTQGTAQFEINFDAGLTDQFPEFSDCLRASVYSCGKPFKNIAADLDVSPSHLSRMLNSADEGVNFPAHRIDELVRATGDKSPIYWLVEKFLQDADAQAKQALREIPAAIEKLTKLAELAELAVSDETKLKVAK